MWEDEVQPAIVIDHGTYATRAGFAGDDLPKSIFPSLIGRPRASSSSSNVVDDKSLFVGSQAQSQRDLLNLIYPIERGIVKDWDSMEKIYEHIFTDQLRVDPRERSILLTEAPLNPKANKEKMLQLMFEKFEAPAAYVAIQAVLSLYSWGRQNGIVLDSGEGVTYTFPIYDGYAMLHAIQRISLSGRDVTDLLMELVNKRGHSFTSDDREIFREMKEKLAYVAGDYNKELQSPPSSVEKEYKLPDGKVITVGNERFQCAEALFEPIDLLRKELPGFHETVYKSIMKCNMDTRKSMFRKIRNVLCSGGNLLLPGMAERLHKELTTLAPPNMNFNIYLDSKPAAWIGGSIFAGLATFPDMCVSKLDYDEEGPAFIHSKCIHEQILAPNAPYLF